MAYDRNVVKFPLKDFNKPEIEEPEEEVIDLGEIENISSENNNDNTSETAEVQFDPINAEKLESIRAESYEKGYNDGKAAADLECERKSTAHNQLTELFTNALQNIEIEKSQTIENLNSLFSDVLALSVEKLTSPANNTDIKRLEDFITNIIASVNENTRLNITIHKDTYSSNKKHIDSLINEKVSIIESANLNENDCTIEWADGCAKLDTESIFKEISSKLQSLSSNQNNPND